jgi:hypothetical protein
MPSSRNSPAHRSYVKRYREGGYCVPPRTRHRHLVLQPPLANHVGTLVPPVLGHSVQYNEAIWDVTVRTSPSHYYSLQTHQRVVGPSCTRRTYSTSDAGGTALPRRLPDFSSIQHGSRLRFRLLLAFQARPRIRLDSDTLCTQITRNHSIFTPASTASRRSAPYRRQKKRSKSAHSRARYLCLPLTRCGTFSSLGVYARNSSSCTMSATRGRHSAVWAGAVGEL